MTAQELKVQDKKELQSRDERTEAARYYTPYTDIFEKGDVIVLYMDMPGVRKEALDITLEKEVLTVTGRVDLSSYDGLEPVYTEYQVGNYTRRFTVSSSIDQSRISARIDDGVLEVSLPKIEEAAARRIEVK